MKIKTDFTGDFTTLNNSILRDKNLSYKAIGLYLQMMSLYHLDGWNYTEIGLASLHKNPRHNKKTGEIEYKSSPDIVSSGLRELEVNGWLTRRKYQVEETGFWDVEYILHYKYIEINNTKNTAIENPILENPPQENPVVDFPVKDFPVRENPLYNKELINKELNNKILIEKKEKDKKELVYPDYINKKAFQEWEIHHKEKTKKEHTKMWYSKNWNILKDFTPFEQQKIIDVCISRNWTGIFPNAIQDKTEWDDTKRKIKKDRDEDEERRYFEGLDKRNDKMVKLKEQMTEITNKMAIN